LSAATPEARVRGSFVVAGIEIAVRGEGRRLERSVLAVLEPYMTDVRNPVCRIALHPMERAIGQDDVAATAQVNGQVLRFRDGWTAGAVNLHGDGQADVVSTPVAVARCLRLVWATVALRHGAFLMAAAGVLYGGRAHLVVGPDEALLRQLASPQRLPLLSASEVALAPTPAGWIAASTPFDGEPVAAPRWAPAAALWFPAEAVPDEVVPLAPAASFTAILERGVRAPDDSGALPILFDRAADVAAAVPAGALRLDRRTLWETVDGLAAALQVRQALLAWERPRISSLRLSDVKSRPETPTPAG
jgi:hypothetical protein